MEGGVAMSGLRLLGEAGGALALLPLLVAPDLVVMLALAIAS